MDLVHGVELLVVTVVSPLILARVKAMKKMKRRERWRSCFLVLVVVGGNSVEWPLERRAAVRSFAAAMMVSSGVADGILKLCGNHFTVCAILVRPVDGTQMLWQR